jgi:hypothetical protein
MITTVNVYRTGPSWISDGEETFYDISTCFKFFLQGCVGRLKHLVARVHPESDGIGVGCRIETGLVVG